MIRLSPLNEKLMRKERRSSGCSLEDNCSNDEQRQEIIKMPNFSTVFMHGNNYKRDGNKYHYRLPTVVKKLNPLKEKLIRERREGDCPLEDNYSNNK